MTPRSRWLLSSLALGAVALLGWAFRPSAVEVETGVVTRGAFVEILTDDGIARVRDRYLVTAPVNGTLMRPTLKVGDAVARGDVIAMILPSLPDLVDPRTRAELVARREAAAARSSRAATLVRDAESAQRQAEQDLSRNEALAQRGFIAATQLEQYRRTLDANRAAAEAARYEAAASRQDYEQSKAALSRLDDLQRQHGDPAGAWTVRSPVEGRVLTMTRESGGPVAVGSGLVEIGDVQRLEAVIDVLSTEATRVRPGAPVTLTAGATATLSGRVRLVEPEARTKISALGVEEQRANVIVDLDDSDTMRVVGDGYRVDARIELSRQDAVLQVPTSALFRRGESWAVYRARDGRAQAATVDIGALAEATAVVRSGLDEGDRVVLYPGDELDSGTRIRERRAP